MTRARRDDAEKETGASASRFFLYATWFSSPTSFALVVAGRIACAVSAAAAGDGGCCWSPSATTKSRSPPPPISIASESSLASTQLAPLGNGSSRVLLEDCSASK